MIAPASRKGATLLEIAVAVGILAIVGAVVYPSLASSRDRTKILSSIAVLRDLTAILDRYDTTTSALGTSCAGLVNCNVQDGRYPRRLRHLVDSIIVGTAAANSGSSCGTAYTTTNVTRWRLTGPFWNRDFAPGVGFRIPIGVVRDTVIRSPLVSGDPNTVPGVLQLQIDSMRIWDARQLKLRVDGYLDDTAVGMVRWSGSPSSDSIIQPVFWTFPAGGC